MFGDLQLLYVKLSSRSTLAKSHCFKIILFEIRLEDKRSNFRALKAAKTARGKGSFIAFNSSGKFSTTGYKLSACESSPSNQYAATPTIPDHQRQILSRHSERIKY